MHEIAMHHDVGELMHRLRDWCEGKGRGPLFT